MSNNLGTNAVGVLGEMILTGLGTKLPMIKRFAHNMRGERAAFGQDITSHTLAEPTVQTFGSQAYNAAASDLIAGAKPLVLDQWKFTKVELTDKEATESDPGHLERLLERHADRAAYQLAKEVVTDGVNIITQANFPLVNAAPPATAGDWDYDLSDDLSSLMNAAEVPGPRYGLLNGSAAQGIRRDGTVIGAMPDDDENPVIIKGSLPNNIAGDKFEEWAPMPEGGAEKRIGFLGHRDALQFGNRLPRDASNLMQGVPTNALIETHTDEQGLSIESRVWYDPGTTVLSIVFAILYGWAPGNPDLLYRIVRQ